MVFVDPEFEVPTIPDDERYEGTEVDPNVLAGERNSHPTKEEGRRRIFARLLGEVTHSVSVQHSLRVQRSSGLPLMAPPSGP